MEKEPRESSEEGVKLVPWMSWDEWLFVYHSIFSHDPLSVASALTRISTWRSRGCIPVTVEITASFIEIQQKDPQLRNGRLIDAADGNQASDISDASLSEEMLAMLYCMAIMRLVNGVVEKTRKQRDFSIAEAADAIGLPRMLIDIRHEGSHRELPTLQVVRVAAAKAIDWLHSYYWEPQRKAIPFLGDSITKIRKRIESKLQELVLCLNSKEISQPSSPSPLKGKRNKKQTAKILKKLAGLYSSCPFEVVSVLLDYLLKALNLPNSVGTSGETISDPSIDSLLEYWKPAVKALLKKDAELIVALLKSVLDMIEIQEDNKFRTGLQNLMTSENTAAQQVEQLSSLFAWLIRNVKQQVKPRQSNSSAVETKSSTPEIPKAILNQLLRKCLMRSCLGNKLLMNSTFNIVQLIGEEDHLMTKLNKIASLVSSNLEIINCTDLKNLLTQQDESIPEATKNLELIKFLRRKRKAPDTTTEEETVSSRRWVVAESWNPCPIGMLPNSAGSSGCLPVLDLKDGRASIQDLSPERNKTSCDGEIAESPICDVAGSDKSCVKKSKVTLEEDFAFDEGKDVPICSGIDGKLMVGGVWSEVSEDDLLAIKSSIRILV